MQAILSKLRNAIRHALQLLGQFLEILSLGLLVAFLYALPWLLRAACVLSWLIGGYMAIQKIQELYGFNSPAGAVLALQFAVIFLMVAWTGTLLLVDPKTIWGGLALGGLLPILVVSKVIPWLFAVWTYADFFFRILPAALFSLALIYLTIRMRFLRSNQKLSLSKPTFNWLFKLRGHHE